MLSVTGLFWQRYLADTGFRIPIVIITAYSADEARAAGAVAFLRKPFSDVALLDAVQVALQRPAHD